MAWAPGTTRALVRTVAATRCTDRMEEWGWARLTIRERGRTRAAPRPTVRTVRAPRARPITRAPEHTRKHDRARTSTAIGARVPCSAGIVGRRPRIAKTIGPVRPRRAFAPARAAVRCRAPVPVGTEALSPVPAAVMCMPATTGTCTAALTAADGSRTAGDGWTPTEGNRPSQGGGTAGATAGTRDRVPSDRSPSADSSVEPARTRPRRALGRQ